MQGQPSSSGRNAAPCRDEGFFLFHIIRHLNNITLYSFHIVSDWSPFNGNQPFVPEARLWVTSLSYTCCSLSKYHVPGWCEATRHRETMWEMSSSGRWGHEKVFKDKKELGTLGKQIYIFPPIFFFPPLYSLCLSRPPRPFRCVHGWEHHGSRGDRGGDGSYPAPARGPGAPRVRAALHVSLFLCVSLEH